MAKNTQISNNTVNVQGDALAALCNGGTLNIYQGSQPADANTAISGATLLAALTFPTPAAPATVNGVITFNTLPPVNAVATGTAGFYRILKSDGTTVVMDGSVGTSSANMILNNTSIVSGAQVSITGFTHSVLESSSGL